MRFRNLFLYWLAVGLGGMLAFAVPGVGFAFGIGALLYFVYAIAYWLLFMVSLQHKPQRRTVFGVEQRRFVVGLAAGAGVLCLASLLLGWRGFACIGAALLFYCGELELKTRMLAAAGRYDDWQGGA